MTKRLPVITRRAQEGGVVEEIVNPRVKKLDLERFRAGTDRVFHHEGLGIFVRCRMQITKQRSACKACGDNLVRVGEVILYPVRVSVVQCNEDGEVMRREDGSLKVVASFNHGIAADGVTTPEHFSYIKSDMRDLVFAALEGKANLNSVLAENVVDELDPPDLRSETEKLLQRNLEIALVLLEDARREIGVLQGQKTELHGRLEANVGVLVEADGVVKGLQAELDLARSRCRELELELDALRNPKKET